MNTVFFLFEVLNIESLCNNGCQNLLLRIITKNNDEKYCNNL